MPVRRGEAQQLEGCQSAAKAPQLEAMCAANGCRSLMHVDFYADCQAQLRASASRQHGHLPAPAECCAFNWPLQATYLAATASISRVALRAVARAVAVRLAVGHILARHTSGAVQLPAVDAPRTVAGVVCGVCCAHIWSLPVSAKRALPRGFIQRVACLADIAAVAHVGCGGRAARGVGTLRCRGQRGTDCG